MVPGLVAEVVVTRDGLGVATLEGRDRVDLARALGFLHAQERFFQMDLLRRRGAGELSALVGSAALDVDRSARVHRFRDRARKVLAKMPAPERVLLAAYSAGVNHGLEQLGARPFEYFLLRTRPQPWREEDSFLVVYAMYFTLQDEDGAAELARRAARRQLPRALFDLLTASGSEWDAPLWGGPLPTPPLPAASDLAGWQPRFQPPDQIFPADENFPGSNSLAVSGQHSRTGAALLAGDMHLALGVPNIWYRAQLRYQSGAGPAVVTGVTLPGVPLVVAGSNGHVAWAFTNSYGDWSDLVVLDEPRPGRYLTPEGELPLVQVVEKIEVAGGAPVSLTVEETVWGPVVSRDGDGRRCVYRWVAHDPEQAMNLSLEELERARNASQALEVARRVRLPAQNFVVADAEGHIGWTIAGAIPRRLGWDGQLAQSWSDGRHRWEGYLPPEQYPRLEDPPSGRIWTANNRLVGAEGIALLGDGGYDHGARAQQIRDALLALPRADEKAMLAIQLDDRAPLLARWQRTPARAARRRRPGRQSRLAVSWRPKCGAGPAGPTSTAPPTAWCAGTAGCSEKRSTAPGWSMHRRFGAAASPTMSTATCSGSWPSARGSSCPDPSPTGGSSSLPSWIPSSSVTAPAARSAPVPGVNETPCAFATRCPRRFPSSAPGSTPPPSHCPATATCPACRDAPSAPPSAWSSHPGTRRAGSSTCRAARAATLCRPFTWPATPTGRQVVPAPFSRDPPPTPCAWRLAQRRRSRSRRRRRACPPEPERGGSGTLPGSHLPSALATPRPTVWLSRSAGRRGRFRRARRRGK